MLKSGAPICTGMIPWRTSRGRAISITVAAIRAWGPATPTLTARMYHSSRNLLERISCAVAFARRPTSSADSSSSLSAGSRSRANPCATAIPPPTTFSMEAAEGLRRDGERGRLGSATGLGPGALPFWGGTSADHLSRASDRVSPLRGRGIRTVHSG